MRDDKHRNANTTEDFKIKADIKDQMLDTDTINEALKRMPTDENIIVSKEPEIKIDMKAMNGPL